MFRRFFEKTSAGFKRLLNRLAAQLYMAVSLKDRGDIEDVKRYLDKNDRRHYQKNGQDVYSVTTILDELEEDKSGLEWWKKHNDGVGDNPDWEHILEYKQNRGTLAHHTAMAEHYEDVNPGEKLWSDDESSSLYEVMDRVGDPEFLYSIVADRDWVNTKKGFKILQENEDIDISDILMEDLQYFKDEYDRICQEKGIGSYTLEAVEEMFVVPPNGEHDGYGGQADLVYRDPMTGGVVVADLKTSSKIRSKHKYQAAAYAKAIEKTGNLDVEEVERAEIIRIYPDENESEVYEFTDFEQYWDKFAETTKEM